MNRPLALSRLMNRPPPPSAEPCQRPVRGECGPNRPITARWREPADGCGRLIGRFNASDGRRMITCGNLRVLAEGQTQRSRGNCPRAPHHQRRRREANSPSPVILPRPRGGGWPSANHGECLGEAVDWLRQPSHHTTIPPTWALPQATVKLAFGQQQQCLTIIDFGTNQTPANRRSRSVDGARLRRSGPRKPAAGTARLMDVVGWGGLTPALPAITCGNPARIFGRRPNSP
jgi:hypothetical protein